MLFPQHTPLLILHSEFDREKSVRITGWNLVTGSCVDQSQCELHAIAGFRRRGIGLDLHSDRPFDHVRIMPSSPEMLAPPPDGTVGCDRPVDFRHMAALADEATLLHEEFPFVLGIGPAGSYAVELRRAGHHVMATIADLHRAKVRIKF